MANTRTISADSHVQEPPELYAKRVPSKYRDKTPRVEERDGGRYMIVDGKRPRRLDIAAAATTDDDKNREFRSDDPIALNNIGFTGADCLLWGSDYPHDEGTFPHSQSVIDRTFQGISESDKRKIVYDNAARIYGMVLP